MDFQPIAEDRNISPILSKVATIVGPLIENTRLGFGFLLCGLKNNHLSSFLVSTVNEKNSL